MSDDTPPTTPDPQPETPAPVPVTTVGFSISADDALNLVNNLGALIAMVDPALAPLVAAATGAATFLEKTVWPAIQHLGQDQLSVAQQAVLLAKANAERLRLGLPPIAIT
jgi:hypothetical protein